ncbi:beta-microseminoprotein-like [Dendropsophus ebraccatus]|uniref:beta-microseminoprotein-like n=1 Tax=Dendropsophus ebraccatus TaxID=150705 RepID=UPI0038313F87
MRTLPTLHLDGDPGGCEFKGELHAYRTTWRTDDCLKCTCYSNGSMRCCTIGGRPVSYDKEQCVVIFDKETCMHNVVRKDNPNETCEHAAVG